MAKLSLNKMFASLLSTVLLSTTLTMVEAGPLPAYNKHATHRTRHVGRQVKVEAFNPPSTFQIFGEDAPSLTITDSLIKPEWKDTVMSFVSDNLKLNPAEVSWRSGYQEGDSAFAYLRQSANDIPFANAVSNVAFNQGKIASFGSSFIDTTTAKLADPNPTVSWRSVLPQLEESLNAKYNNLNATLEYYVQPSGDVALTHVIQLQNKETGAWLEAFIDAHSGDLVSVSDFVAHASYTVVPITKDNLDDGLETLTDPQDLEASPLGWHSIAADMNSTDTSGNNVVAFLGQDLGSQTSAGLNFNARYNANRQPTNAQNMEASKTNAFYVINSLHDVTYRYGFTESAFNFQQNNFGKGGRDGDRVEISVQDARGTNNAQFATPPDGTPGICRMFVWTLTDIPRDGSMENNIIIHEFTHGITNRMTGGGTGRCLQTLESGGLGEGWGDALADWFSQESPDTRDFVLATHVLGNQQGLRAAPYSVNARTNPLRYSDAGRSQEVHEIGEVWANMLHNVYAALVEDKGFSADKLTNPDGPEGNIIFMRLFIDSLALQPCNPTFVQARDAWELADRNRYDGANRCTILRAFASRGLGANAARFRDDTTVAAGC